MTPSTIQGCALGVRSETLSALRDGALGINEARALQAHIAGCQACQGRLREYDALGGALRDERPPEPDERLWHGVRAALRRGQRRAGRFGQPRQAMVSAVGALAAVLLLALGFTLLFHALRGGTGITNTPTATQHATPTPTPTPTLTITPTATPGLTFPTHWQTASGLPPNVLGYAFAASAPRVGYACTEGSATAPFLATSDGGATWTTVATGVGGSDLCGLSVNPADPRDVLLWDEVFLSRSRDGGRTWQSLGSITGPTGPSQWRHVVVLGSRLVAAAIAASDAGSGLRDDLYASDDGGTTWQPLARGLWQQGVNVGDFVLAGSTLSVIGYPSAACGILDTCGPLSAPLGGYGPDRSAAPLLPRSGDGPPQDVYYSSTDGGRTLTKATFGGAPHLSGLRFTPKADGSGYYGVVLSTADNLVTTVWYSGDSGATWRALPTLNVPDSAGSDPRTLGLLGRLVAASDGTVIAAAWQSRENISGGGETGLFRLTPSDAQPVWQPLAPPGHFVLLTDPQGSGVRLWGLATTSQTGLSLTPTSGASLDYVTLP
jgi:hypothetical protein